MVPVLFEAASLSAMRVLVMTKPFGALSPGALADLVATMPVDGAEIVVRDGQTVTPAKPAQLRNVAQEFDRHGLGMDIVTTDVVTADATADRLFGMCADLGVPLVRLGWWRYDRREGYQRLRDRARRDLAGLAELAARHGVRPALQLHHGTVHPSAAHALHLIPDGVAIYADPGNQAMEGSESWDLTLDQLGERLACVGVKNAAPRDGGLQWQPLADGGVVDWPAALRTLRERNMDVPLSVHAHYAGADEASVRRDVRFLRTL